MENETQRDFNYLIGKSRGGEYLDNSMDVFQHDRAVIIPQF